MSEVDDARAFLRRRLGPDWEVRLMGTDALPRQRVTGKDTDAAQQRAVALVSEVCEDWTPELSDAVADAWRVLSAKATRS